MGHSFQTEALPVYGADFISCSELANEANVGSMRCLKPSSAADFFFMAVADLLYT